MAPMAPITMARRYGSRVRPAGLARAPLALVLVLAALAACGNLRRTAPPPLRAAPATDPMAVDPDTRAIKVYWIGHATTLIRLGDVWVLTDPNFSNRVAGIEKRRVAPGVDLDRMPVVDWVLISHAHVDHLDIPSLERLGGSGTLVVPPGARTYLPDEMIPTPAAASSDPPVTPFDEVASLAEWRSVERDGVRITAVPARHSNGRYVIDGLWNRNAHAGYIIERGPLSVYFAGDTGYHPTLFKEIGERFDIDVALLPVGPADRPGWVHRLRRHVHADPAEAMDIFTDVGAQWMVPIHHGTFFKSGPGELGAITAAIDAHPRGDRVRILPIGGAATFLY